MHINEGSNASRAAFAHARRRSDAMTRVSTGSPEAENPAEHVFRGICGHHGSASLCAECAVRGLSVCSALGGAEIEEFARLSQTVALAPRATLVVQDEEARHIFSLTSGVVRLYRLLADGRRQIVGFALPGDFLGLAMATHNAFTAEAVGPVAACRFPRDAFARFLEQKPHLLMRLHQMATHELTLAQDQMVLLGRRTAEEKVAAFLLGMRDRWARISGAHLHVPLPMSRQDIGDFLGLTVETVSRMMTRLAREKLLVIVPDGVRILDETRLEAICAA
jgi:CRP/FNR family transcriptional regulator